MAGAIRKSRVRHVPLSTVKDDLSRFLREAEQQDIVITRHGKPAGVLIGFATEDDWFEYRLEKRPTISAPDRTSTRELTVRAWREAGRHRPRVVTGRS